MYVYRLILSMHQHRYDSTWKVPSFKFNGIASLKIACCNCQLELLKTKDRTTITEPEGMQLVTFHTLVDSIASYLDSPFYHNTDLHTSILLIKRNTVTLSSRKHISRKKMKCGYTISLLWKAPSCNKNWWYNID